MVRGPAAELPTSEYVGQATANTTASAYGPAIHQKEAALSSNRSWFDRLVDVSSAASMAVFVIFMVILAAIVIGCCGYTIWAFA
jgi:cell division protein FtsX